MVVWYGLHKCISFRVVCCGCVVVVSLCSCQVKFNIKAAQWTGRLWFCLSLIKHNKEVKGVDVSDGSSG